MGAGTSALREADRASLRVVEYERRLLEERALVNAFRIAGRTEAEVAARLLAMDGWGWRLLADRRWPGTRSANIDMILVGPGGVLVIDVKAWAEPDIVDGRLYRGQSDAEDELDKLRRVTDLVGEVTGEQGLAPTEVVPVLVFVGQRGTDTNLGRVRILDDTTIAPWATSRGARLTDTQVDELTELLDQRFPVHTGADSPVSTVIIEPVLPVGRHAQAEPDTLFDVAALEAAVLAHALAKPVEEWMTFLHPEQVRIARRIGVGPARIRGAAGTGKTVVALHRAAFVAESLPGPVLFTSFVKTLPPVLRSLYARLSPATADRVEFVHLHGWATALLRDRGHHLRIADRPTTQRAFSLAWGRHGNSSALAAVGVPYQYWRDEIDYVLKGRGLTDFDEYAGLRRVGRRTRLTQAQREIVWAMYVEYERQLRAWGYLDFNDLLSIALAEVRARPLDVGYAAVIADEVQDLNCQAIRLLAEISHNGERLLVIGDGQQQLYPGGYTLTEAGISVAGRATVLRTNYRNAANILAASAQVLAEDEFNDLDDASEAGRREIACVREDGRLWTVTAQTAVSLRRQAVEHVRELVASGVEPADIGLLCATNEQVEEYQRLLTGAGIASMKLTDYTGIATNAAKIGTVQRAKGLEFKHVVLTLHERTDRASSPEARREQSERANRQLFVAMTRARDTLWIGRLVLAGDSTASAPHSSISE